MKAADELVDIIKDIIQQELNKRDCVILCRVAAKSVDSDYYDVYVVPDTTVVLHNVPNMTKFNLNIGDYCYVYKIQNNFTNSFICCAKNVN